MLGLTLLKVYNYPYATNECWLITQTEFIETEDRFTDVRDALKTLNKMDFDKLIVSVSLLQFYVTGHTSVHTYIT